jgi:hypothetical protein
MKYSAKDMGRKHVCKQALLSYSALRRNTRLARDWNRVSRFADQKGLI